MIAALGLVLIIVGDVMLGAAAWCRVYGDPTQRGLEAIFLGFHGLLALTIGGILGFRDGDRRVRSICSIHLLAAAVVLLVLVTHQVGF